MIAFRSAGIKIGGEVWRQVSGEGFAIELLVKLGIELLGHQERDEQ